MKAEARLCECGRSIAYFTGKGLYRKGAAGGHNMCRQCWKQERDRNRPVEVKDESCTKIDETSSIDLISVLPPEAVRPLSGTTL